MAENSVREIQGALVAMMHENCRAVRRMEGITDRQVAGTLTLMASAVISHAAFAAAKVSPSLVNAPPERQIADFLDLLREVMTQPQAISGPFSVVPGGKDQADG